MEYFYQITGYVVVPLSDKIKETIQDTVKVKREKYIYMLQQLQSIWGDTFKQVKPMLSLPPDKELSIEEAKKLVPLIKQAKVDKKIKQVVKMILNQLVPAYETYKKLLLTQETLINNIMQEKEGYVIYETISLYTKLTTQIPLIQKEVTILCNEDFIVSRITPGHPRAVLKGKMIRLPLEEIDKQEKTLLAQLMRFSSM